MASDQTTRAYRRGWATTGRYLGMTLHITDSVVTVARPDGRVIGTAYSMSGARRIARGYRGAKR